MSQTARCGPHGYAGPCRRTSDEPRNRRLGNRKIAKVRTTRTVLFHYIRIQYCFLRNVLADETFKERKSQRAKSKLLRWLAPSDAERSFQVAPHSLKFHNL